MTNMTPGPDPVRHVMRGTAAAETLTAANLSAFDWKPDTGDAWDYWHEAGHNFGSSASRATGLVVFEGVPVTSSFQSRAVSVRFSFSDGYTFDGEATPSAWNWNAGTGVLDPVLGGRFTLFDRSVSFTATSARFDAFDILYVWGSVDRGHWVPRVTPLAVEIAAGDGDDTLASAGAADRLLGEAGNDRLDGGGGRDSLLGGDGRDTLEGGDAADVLDGQRGDDLILGGAGRDVASGGSGNDTLSGGEGQDTLFGHAGDDRLEGGAGADMLIGGAGEDEPWGFDTAIYTKSSAGVAIDLQSGQGHGGDAEGDVLHGISALVGSSYADSLTGGEADEQLVGGGGDDLLVGAGGADTLSGGRGDDRLDGGVGKDLAVVAGRISGFSLVRAEDGHTAWLRDIDPSDGDEGLDLLTGIETIRFADAKLSLGAMPAAGPRAIFAAADPTFGNELWVSDGTTAGTRLLTDIAPGIAGSDPGSLMPFGDGRFAFLADDGIHGRELWVTDGTTAGTALLADINPGAAHGGTWSWLALGDGRALFSPEDGAHGRELWITDGNTAGTRLVKDVLAGPSGSAPSNLEPLGDGRAVFTVSTPDGGGQIWVTDGTEAGTVLLRAIADGATAAPPGDLTQIRDGQIIFAATDASHGRELWTTDGTASGTILLKDIWPMAGNGSPFAFTPIGDGRAIFNATGSSTGEELWITDGTAAGTRLLKDIAPGSARSFPTEFTPLDDGRVVFTAYGAGAYSDRELYVTDGTAAGTRMVKDIWPDGGSSTPSGLTAFGAGKVLFQAEDPAHGNELWVSDGTADGTYLVKDIWPGPVDWDFDRGTISGSGNPGNFVVLEDRAVFQASDGNGRNQLWITDGTEDGTMLIHAFGGAVLI